MKKSFMNRAGLLAGSAVLFLSSSLPALAEEGERETLPQLDPRFYPDELFWLFVSFFLFFLMMQLWAVPKFQRTQGNRRQLLDSDLSAARKASDQAKAALVDGDKALAEARAEMRRSVEEITNEANAKAAELRAAQEKKIAARLAEANAKIETARKAAMQDVPAMVDDLVVSITSKILAPAASK